MFKQLSCLMMSLTIIGCTSSEQGIINPPSIAVPIYCIQNLEPPTSPYHSEYKYYRCDKGNMKAFISHSVYKTKDLAKQAFEDELLPDSDFEDEMSRTQIIDFESNECKGKRYQYNYGKIVYREDFLRNADYSRMSKDMVTRLKVIQQMGYDVYSSNYIIIDGKTVIWVHMDYLSEDMVDVNAKQLAEESGILCT